MIKLRNMTARRAEQGIQSCGRGTFRGNNFVKVGQLPSDLVKQSDQNVCKRFLGLAGTQGLCAIGNHSHPMLIHINNFSTLEIVHRLAIFPEEICPITTYALHMTLYLPFNKGFQTL